MIWNDLLWFTKVYLMLKKYIARPSTQMASCQFWEITTWDLLMVDRCHPSMRFCIENSEDKTRGYGAGSGSRWVNELPQEMDSGWWFGTFFIFPYIGNNHPNWLIFFRGVQTTNKDWSPEHDHWGCSTWYHAKNTHWKWHESLEESLSWRNGFSASKSLAMETLNGMMVSRSKYPKLDQIAFKSGWWIRIVYPDHSRSNVVIWDG